MTPDAIRAWLVERVAEITGGPVDPDRPLQEAGLSSRDATILTGDLGQFLGHPLPATFVWQHPSITALVTALSTVDVERPAPAPMAAGEPIAIVGVGCRLPGGVESPAQFWRFLDAGADGIGEVPEGRWESFAPAEALAGLPRRGGFLGDVAGFDAAFFGITPREAEAMDPQQRTLLEVTWAALEHAGIPPGSLRGTRTGVFVGLSASEYGYLTMTDVTGIDAWSGTGAAASIAANRLSYLLDLRGPSLTLDTACSSSLVAVHQAVQSLRRGESETALVAGVNLLLSPGITANFHRAGVLAPDGQCKPFDAGADGIVRGEGCGVVVLKPLKAARAAGDRVLAVIRGSAVNSDGRSNGMMAPNPDAQAALLRDAYAVAGVDPSSVDYVEAHGTGTLLGDPIEAGALGEVLGAGREPGRPLLVGSVKSNLGHLEGAAGIAGLIKVVLALVHRRLPPSLNYHEPNPHIDFDGLGLRVVAAGTGWPRYPGTARAGVSAFGFGGTNAHVVMEEWPAAAFPPRADAGGPRIFVLSARSADVLRARALELADWLDSPAGRAVPLGAVASTLATRREHLPVRAAVVAEDRGALVNALRDVTPDETRGRADVVFVFSGYGSQWPEMGRELLRTEPAFRAEIDALDPAFRAEAGFSLREVLAGERELPDLGATQLALFGMQTALAGLWRAHGVVPAAVLGHSMGEVAAAVVAGALDVTDGLRVMATRARLLAEVDAAGTGAMAVVELSPAELAEFPDVTVAVYASPTQCTVSGDADQVDALVAHVEQLGRLARRLPVRGAGHSAAVDAVLDRFRLALTGLEPGQAEIPCYSTVLDDPHETPTFDVEYWAANLRRPVRFTQALAAATDDGHRVFVEISPHPIALAAVEQTTGGAAIGLPTGSRKIGERVAFLTSLARLHVLGRLGVLDHGPRTAPVELPGPIWRHERFWPSRRPGAGVHPLLGVHIEQPGGDLHLWRGDVGTAQLPWLTDHAAMGVPLFPATGFLELALAAGDRIGDLELHQVLPLAEHTEVTTSLSGGNVSVHARSGPGWVRHATARVLDGAPPPTPFGPVSGDPVDVYRALEDLGQSYGPAFRGLRRVVATPGRASASIALPPEARDHPAYRLHPALADACLHALAATTKLGDAAGLYLPLTIGEVTLAGDPRGGVRVDAVLDSVDESGAGLLGSVQLVDAEGAVLVEFRDVYCRRFQRPTLPGRVFEAGWEQSELPPADANGTHSWVVLREAPEHEQLDDARCTVPLGDREGLAKVLRSGEVTGVLAMVGCASELGTPDPSRAAALVLTLSSVAAELASLPTPPRLWLVSAGAAAVEPGEPGHPDLAALRGLVRVLAFEHPELRATHLDFDAEPDPAHLWLTKLQEEVRADTPDDEIAWREGIRFTRRLVRPTLTEPPPGGPDGNGPAIASTPPASADGGAGHGRVRTEIAEPPRASVGGVAGRNGVCTQAAEASRGSLGGVAERDGSGPAVAEAQRGSVARRDGNHSAAAEALRGSASKDAVPVVRKGAYLITGGLGGLGLVAAKWLADRGATRLILSGRSGPTPDTEDFLRDLNVDIQVLTGDIAEPGTAEKLVAAAGDLPLRGVLHAAGTLADEAAIGLTKEAVESVWRPKALGAWRLHEATAGLDLDWWLLYSSAAALFGSPGQAAYATANAWADALVAWRRAQGLPAATINWGAWGEAGAAVGSRNPVLEPLGTAEALDALEVILGSDREATGVARVDTEAVLALFPRLAERPFFELFVPSEGPSTWDGMAALHKNDPEQARKAMTDHLAALVAGLMGFPRGEVDRHAPLTSLGLDSLMAMRARGAVERDFGLPLPVPLLLRGASLTEIAGHLAEQAGFGAGAPAEPRPTVLGPRDPAERWVARHWQAVLGGPEPGVYEDFKGNEDQTKRLREAFAEDLDDVPDADRLFATPTIAAMADLLRAQVEGFGGGPVRLLRDGVAADPVFLFHPAGGPTSVYQELVRLLPEGQPAYGLERIDEEDTVEGKAACYVELLREIQPHGPYRLGGWSFGGCLAYETAKRLTAAGESVDVVFMIDTILPLPAPETKDLLLDRFDRFAEHIELTYGVPLEIPRAELEQLGEHDQIRLVLNRLAAQVPGMGQGVLHHQYTSYVDARVAERYDPGPYAGKVLLLRAQDPHPLTTTLDPRYLRTDDPLGWDAHCADLEIVRVPGDHLSMIDPPHVSVIADALSAVLTGLPAGRG
ncbi:beta-ketoacyl synthase N-terminal-like domain-containing protein [Amycolatopsis sp., V23-08]|uniref:Beta-ketoacyl synthase N-terminal-like domain-containing protein n=1 Tax=Amycolatopsis heterodermiae TaxID=3110235 RepID=A0ABU5RMN9_9PSEU|nr:polyketide synthase [Amycolatopsis sp., V23-08]MEA5366760.1 beta-ketoacyl synthase N-terminal-like domain-containing protein [Amycolatopsis sp., V23-08]